MNTHDGGKNQCITTYYSRLKNAMQILNITVNDFDQKKANISVC